MSLFHTTYNPLSKIWSGRPVPPTFHPNVNAAQVLLDAMNRNPEGIGQINVNNGLMLTNRELRMNTIRMAQNLNTLGIRSGDVVTVLAANHHHVSSVLFGAMALGAPVQFLGYNFNIDEITHLLEKTQPKIVFCQSSNIDRVRLALVQLRLDISVYIFDDESPDAFHVNELLLETGNEVDFIPILLTSGHSHAAVILCSSGTTGLPKSVPLSHALILYEFNQQKCLRSDDIQFVHSQLFWISAISSIISTTLMGATRILTTDEVTPGLALHIWDTYRVSMTTISLYTISMMLQSQTIHTVDLSCMKKLVCGGSVISDAQCQKMQQFIPNGRIVLVYGMTETGGTVARGKSGDRESAVGLLLPGYHIRIVSDNGSLCGPNEEGELHIKGEIPYMGYWNDSGSTQELLDEDGWLRSGDIGRFDADGYLYITDRKKDIIKYKGENVSPAKVENIVLAVPGVKAVCVVGVFDKEVVERPTALVVRDDNCSVTELMIHDTVDEKIQAKGILCGGVYFVENLPKTHSGKVRRRDVKAMAAELYNR